MHIIYFRYLINEFEFSGVAQCSFTRVNFLNITNNAISNDSLYYDINDPSYILTAYGPVNSATSLFYTATKFLKVRMKYFF